jgi:vacuolar-type H+-ATPase subunit B/Vma2
MKTIKITGKKFLSKTIVALLLTANVSAYIVTDNFFSTRTVATEQEENKDLVSRLNTGWQMLDWSFSLIDYFRSVGDRKN